MAADLAIVIDDGQTIAMPGEGVTYTITATNPGPAPPTGATVSDVLPSILTGATWTCVGSAGGVCSAGGSGNIADTVDLPMGASVTYTLNATVDPNATGLLSNTVTVSVPCGFVDAVPGEFTMYTINVGNAGPNPAVGAQVLDIFPQEIKWASWACDDAGGGTCSEASGNGNIETTVDLPVGASEFIFLNRFTPAEFPVEITQVQVFFSANTGISAGDPIDVYLYQNTSGNSDPAVGAAHVGGQTGNTVVATEDWTTVTLTTPLQFNGPGDILVAVVHRLSPGVSINPAALDQTSPQQRSWVGLYTTTTVPDPRPCRRMTHGARSTILASPATG